MFLRLFNKYDDEYEKTVSDDYTVAADLDLGRRAD